MPSDGEQGSQRPRRQLHGPRGYTALGRATSRGRVGKTRWVGMLATPTQLPAAGGAKGAGRRIHSGVNA